MIYLYLGIAILVLGSAAYLIYRKRSGQSPQGSEAELSEQTLESEAPETEAEPEEEPARITPAHPAASATRGTATRTTARPAIPAPRGTPTRATVRPAIPSRPAAQATRETSRRTPERPANSATRGPSKQITPEPPEAPATEKATYPIKEYSTLPDDAKVQFMNAVWYRCENPYCNHTEFLDVHHIIDDGSNNLNNLIVLCPRCNTAAHNNEITVEELKSWLVEREKRFKTDLDWPYR